jgi:hypothetical protein
MGHFLSPVRVFYKEQELGTQRLDMIVGRVLVVICGIRSNQRESEQPFTLMLFHPLKFPRFSGHAISPAMFRAEVRDAREEKGGQRTRVLVRSGCSVHQTL